MVMQRQPPVSPTEFPKFPTMFSPEDRERIKELTEQRKEMERIYKTKFSEEVWEAIPQPERTAREFTPPWLAGAVKVLTPGEAGTWDFGFTPEQFKQQTLDVEEEFQELSRRETITSQLPDIQSGIIIAALQGKPIMDKADLMSTFPELGQNFNQEEIDYLSRLSEAVLHAKPEDILSGDVFKEVSEKDLEDLLGDPKKIKDPRFFHSSVTFIKDLEGIKQALKDAYPSEVEKFPLPEKVKQGLMDYFKQRNIEAGIVPPDGEPTKESIKVLNEKIAEESGISMVLTDNKTGTMFSARRKADNTVWVGKDLVGSYDAKTGGIFPLSPTTGKPMTSELEKEFVAKDLWDAFYLGAASAWHGTKQAILSIVPKAIMSIPVKREDTPANKAFESWRQGIVQTLQSQQDIRQAEYEEWLKAHPELQPKPEYTQSPVDNPALLKDPEYWGYTIVSNAPMIGAALATGILTSLATGNPVAGAVAGAAILTPSQISSVEEDLVKNGADPSNSAMLASSVGTLIGAVEIVPGMITLKAVSPVFMRVFRKNLQTEISKDLIKQMSVKGILATTSKIEVSETLEEVVQQAMQNAAVKTVNENRSLVEDLPETAIQSAIAILPLAAFGGGAEYLNMKANLPPEAKQELDDTEFLMKKYGLTPFHAQAVAVTQLIETETGQAQVEEAVVQSKEKLPSGERIVALEKKLSEINSDLGYFRSILANKQADLEKAEDAIERASLQKSVDRAQERVSEMEKDREHYQKRLDKVRKEVVKTEETPMTESLSTPVIDPRIQERLKAINESLAKDPTNENLLALKEKLGVTQEPSQVEDRVIVPPKAQEGQGVETAKTPLLKSLWEMSDDELLENVTLDTKARVVRFPKGGEIITTYNKYLNYKEGLDIFRQEAKRRGLKVETKGIIPPKAQETPSEAELGIEEAPTPESFQFITPYEQADPLVKTRRPRILDWSDEQEGLTKANQDKKITGAVKLPENIGASRDIAETAFNKLYQEYKDAKSSKDKDKISEVEKRVGTVAKEAGVRKKDLLGKGWDGLPPDAKVALAIHYIPNGSLKARGEWQLLDMEYLMEFLEELTGAPFYSVLRRIEDANATAETTKEVVLKRISTDPNFKNIRTDEAALERVAQELNARNEAQGIEHPENLADEEMLMADAIEQIYNSYKPIVRYLRFMRTVPELDEIKKEFPDAVDAGLENELRMALDLRNNGNLDDLWNFLYAKTWGVIEHGFDPRLISNPHLQVKHKGGLRASRGRGRLLRREAIDYPEGKMSGNVLARLAVYIEQMEIQWRIEPELDTLDGYWDMVAPKFSNFQELKKGLETWVQRVQNMSLGYNWADRIIRRLWRQAMVSVFIEPAMALRNSVQAPLMHPDRSELVKMAFQRIPANITEQGRIYFDTFVSELGGLRRDWLHAGEKGWLIPEWWNRFADSVNLYGASDYYPRMWSFMASLHKAYRATEQYKQDGNIQKWLKNSGAMHLRQSERNYVLTHYLGQPDTNFDKGVKGLSVMSGLDMANYYLAQRMADITNFKYRRSTRGLIEMGNTGSTLWNLIVFPRGYAQRLYFQGEKIKNTFGGKATWAEARGGFNDIMGLVIVSLIFGQIYTAVTGRKKNPYFVIDILFGWGFGGLFVGIGQDVTNLISTVATLINPLADKDSKNIAWAKLPMEAITVPDTLVPFYKRAMDILDATMDKENIDRKFLRDIRAFFDKNYTPEKLEALDMSTWEKIRKASIGGKQPDPTKIEATMKRIDEAEGLLGTRQVGGKYYTLKDFSGALRTNLKEIPDFLITEQEGFSPLVLFWKESEAQLKELESLPAEDREHKFKEGDLRKFPKQYWRSKHPLEEAMLLFWGKYDKSVFVKGSKEGKEVTSLLRIWFDKYDVDNYSHPHWANWSIPPIPTTRKGEPPVAGRPPLTGVKK